MSDTLYGTDDEEATGKVRTCFCKKDVSSEDPNNPWRYQKVYYNENTNSVIRRGDWQASIPPVTHGECSSDKCG